MQAEAPRQFLLLFDLQYSPIEGVVGARKAGMAFVRDALAPGDLVAVATMSRRGLNVLTHFTSDHEYVARAVAGLGLVSPLSTDALGLGGDSFVGGSGTLADAELADLDSLMKDAKETTLSTGRGRVYRRPADPGEAPLPAARPQADRAPVLRLRGIVVDVGGVAGAAVGGRRAVDGEDAGRSFARPVNPTS